MADEQRPDPQRLAAFHEGRLSDADRRDMIAQLAKEPEDLALIADVAAIEGALRGAAAPQLHASRRKWSAGRGALLAAAALVLVAGVSTLYTLGTRPRALPPDLSFAFTQWRVHRGAAIVGDSVTLSWRLGTRLADIEALIAARDSVRLRLLAGEVAALLASSPASIAAPWFARIADSAGARPARLRHFTQRGREAALVGVDQRIVALAHRMEASRIAAHIDPKSATEAGIRTWIADLESIRPDMASRIRADMERRDPTAFARSVSAALDTLGR